MLNYKMADRIENLLTLFVTVMFGLGVFTLSLALIFGWMSIFVPSDQVKNKKKSMMLASPTFFLLKIIGLVGLWLND